MTRRAVAGLPAHITQAAQAPIFVGRQHELARLDEAIRKRQSLLIWGPRDAGKTALIQRAIGGLPIEEQRGCIYRAGASSGRELVSHLIRELYLADDPLVCQRVSADGAEVTTLNRWLDNQSFLRLQGILFRATEQGTYWFFLDHFPPITQKMARLIKEIMYRCKTPIYLAARGYSHSEVGYAWSLYWTDKYWLGLGPLPKRAAGALLELYIRRFGLSSLDLTGFRAEIAALSGGLPGAIIEMCKLAGDERYHHGQQVKTKLVHVDYLMRPMQATSTDRRAIPHERTS